MPAPKDTGGSARLSPAGAVSLITRAFEQRAAKTGASQAAAAAKAQADARAAAGARSASGRQQVQALLQAGQARAASTGATAAAATSTALSVGLANLFLNQGAVQPQSGGGVPNPTQPGGGGNPGGPLAGGSFMVGKWMQNNGYGKADYSHLVAVGSNGLPSTNGKWYLRPDVAAAFQSMDKEYFQQTGQHIRLVSAYRNFGTPYEAQRKMDWRQSDHASGGAIDICGTSCSGSQVAELNWMKSHAASFGFGVWGGNWGDDGHFSFSAGGFNGWMTSYTGPTAADQRWITLANQWYY